MADAGGGGALDFFAKYASRLLLQSQNFFKAGILLTYLDMQHCQSYPVFYSDSYYDYFKMSAARPKLKDQILGLC